MSLICAIIIIIFCLAVYPFIVLSKLLESLAAGASIEALKYIVIFLIISIVIGILISLTGESHRNRISKVIATVVALLSFGYYIFGYLVRQLYLKGSGLGVTIDFIIVLFVLFFIYYFCFSLMVSDSKTFITPLVVGIATCLIVYAILHLDPNDFKEYQKAIPYVYGLI